MMNIVVGLTTRPESRVALEYAIDEARLRGGHLHVVRIVEEEFSESPTKTQGWSKLVTQVRSEGNELQERLEAKGIDTTVRIEPINSDAAATLLQAARQVEADLVVIGIRRRSPVGKLILGSVSQKVLLEADCPVLAVKGLD